MDTLHAIKNPSAAATATMDADAQATWVCAQCGGTFSAARIPWSHDGVQRCNGCVERQELTRRLEQAEARAHGNEHESEPAQDPRYREAIHEIAAAMNGKDVEGVVSLPSIRLARIQAIVDEVLRERLTTPTQVPDALGDVATARRPMDSRRVRGVDE